MAPLLVTGLFAMIVDRWRFFLIALAPAESALARSRLTEEDKPPPGSRGSGRRFERQEGALGLRPADVSAERTVRPHDAVARHDDGQRIRGARRADRSHRLGVADRPARPERNFRCARSRCRPGGRAQRGGSRARAGSPGQCRSASWCPAKFSSFCRAASSSRCGARRMRGLTAAASVASTPSGSSPA